MAGSSYNYDKSNPFFSSDDVDDAAFLKSGRRAYESSSMDERRQQLLEEKRKIEERTVQSSYRSLSLLHESEKIGIDTAEELNRQREQLQNSEVKLDEINNSLRVSQKHIQGIKSVFGSIRNYFSGSKNDGLKLPGSSSASALDKSQGLSPVPEDESPTEKEIRPHPVDRFRCESIPTSRQVDDVLDQNLQEIGTSISRLKNLGLDLNKEIDDQNSLLDRITRKAESTDLRINSQTKDMNRILKK